MRKTRTMADLYHECGIAAVYHLPPEGTIEGRPIGAASTVLLPNLDTGPYPADHAASALIPRLLLEIQNRGQLAAGFTRYCPQIRQEKDAAEDESKLADLLRTHKNVGTVSEVFQLNHKARSLKIVRNHLGPAAIGHVRYATCGSDDVNNAQPFHREHVQKSKNFAFGFNGQLANQMQLRDEILREDDFHLSRDSDTEILMHLICLQLSLTPQPSLKELLANIAKKLDGAYNISFLNARGDLFVARDPLGIRPLCYAVDGPLFAAASESIALTSIGFPRSSIRDLAPGEAVIIEDGHLTVERFAESPKTAHCFFEWIYFANVASTLDGRSVYLSRKRLGEELADQERQQIDSNGDWIVVPVPDTARAAADGMAYKLGIPCLEGLIRNRYALRTFIQGTNRSYLAKTKYTPLPEVLEGKRVLLVDDTIVRSTTMAALISQLREVGKAKEIHVRVACPPIVAPCFYGIDMSRVSELFAPKFVGDGPITPEIEDRMARELNADSLHYLSIEAIARSLNLASDRLCQACINHDYPTPGGTALYQIALDVSRTQPHATTGRTYEGTGPRDSRSGVAEPPAAELLGARCHSS